MKIDAQRASKTRPALERLIRYCQWAREFGCLGVITFLPLVFNPYSERPFEPAKVNFFRWVLLVLLSLLIVERLLVMTNRVRSPDTHPRTGWRFCRGNPLALPVLAYGGLYLVATLFSIDPQKSWWGGNDERGTVTLLGSLAFFFLVADNLRSTRQMDRVIRAFLLGTIPVTLYAMVQSIGLDPLPWVSDSISPALSTMGRSNFLGAYLAMAVPFALVPIVSVRNVVPTAVPAWDKDANPLPRPQPVRSGRFAILVLALVAGVFLSQARAAWLALTLGLLVFFVLLARRRRSGILWCVSLLVLILGALGQVFLARIPLTIWRSEPSGRADVDLPYSELRTETVNSRLAIWRGTLALMGERWLLGYGPESFDSLYHSRYPSDASLGGLGMRVDDPHNLFLAHLVAVGAMGLAAFLVVTGFFYSWTLRALHLAPSAVSEALCAAILASATAFLIQAQFNPDVIVTWVLYWVVLAVSTAVPVECSG